MYPVRKLPPSDQPAKEIERLQREMESYLQQIQVIEQRALQGKILLYISLCNLYFVFYNKVSQLDLLVVYNVNEKFMEIFILLILIESFDNASETSFSV